MAETAAFGALRVGGRVAVGSAGFGGAAHGAGFVRGGFEATQLPDLGDQLALVEPLPEGCRF